MLNRACVLPLALSITCVLGAQEEKTAAKALVKSAIAFAKSNGMEKLIFETNSPKGRFHVQADGDLYIFVYDDKGTCHGQGFRGNLVGVNRWTAKDPDGVLYIQDIIKTGLSKGGGWTDYKYLSPKTGKVEPKTSYVESVNGMVFGCGVYK